MAKRAFIVRPFNKKEGVDFEKVHKELIAPALKALKIEGDTTGPIKRAGNIRDDMFKLIATAELVIADISIHNANVFYELGIRHALRSKHTFLIKAKVGKKKPDKSTADLPPPFDLLTDRYLEYSAKSPRESLPDLIEGLRQTLLAVDDTDSPVLHYLQDNKGTIRTDVGLVFTAPHDFRDEVARAEAHGRVGDLSLLSEETERLPWESEGLRVVGQAQVKVASWEAARETLERVREFDEKDLQANTQLATIYAKLKDYEKSNQAIDRVLKDAGVQGPARAELGALRGSNFKSAWINDWEKKAEPVEREKAALRSAYAAQAYKAYLAASQADLNHFYSGLNALALAIVLLELGKRHPGVWSTLETDPLGKDMVQRRYELSKKELKEAVALAMSRAEAIAAFQDKRDEWLEISKVDLRFLKEEPAEDVASQYETALTGCKRFHYQIVKRQLDLYRQLGIFPEATSKVLAVIESALAKQPAEAASASPPARVLLFTGHRIDAPDREKKKLKRRFPAAAEGAARKMIAEAIDAEIEGVPGKVIGLAGGASGGDILFHELCAERGIETEMFIVSSREDYVKASVQDAQGDWVERFDALWATRPVRVLGNSNEKPQLPRWLRPAKDYSIWERNNRWTLHNALVYGAQKVTLIALWNGEKGDGPGGTKDMVSEAKRRSAKVKILDAKPLAKLK